ncbi:hypothetical protein LVB87_14425 [Lysobacter sp. KIS68-7]|uniref:hypothetical protein n=1 Tax=Lysobacter sp. KIS68-7 TaxID=2904252 RepID=UPI001E3F831D|nr:hypothetical protein [Lysobacter sp. KIS68-7]UHQ19363.1 hypothetical protein LVB87_14425 [Lysobacter sp. KIS68-7]
MRSLLFALVVAATVVPQARSAEPSGPKTTYFLPVFTEARNEAVGAALTRDIVFRSLGSNCSVADPAFGVGVDKAYMAWRTRHLAQLDSAHKYLVLVAVMSERETHVPVKEFYNARKIEFDDNARASLRNFFPDKPTAAKCDEIAARIDDGTFDFKNEPQYAQALIGIQADMTKWEAQRERMEAEKSQKRGE